MHSIEWSSASHCFSNSAGQNGHLIMAITRAIDMTTSPAVITTHRIQHSQQSVHKSPSHSEVRRSFSSLQLGQMSTLVVLRTKYNPPRPRRLWNGNRAGKAPPVVWEVQHLAFARWTNQKKPPPVGPVAHLRSAPKQQPPEDKHGFKWVSKKGFHNELYRTQSLAKHSADMAPLSLWSLRTS